MKIKKVIELLFYNNLSTILYTRIIFKGSPYFELMAFTKYVFNEGIFQHWIREDWPRCAAITKVDECKSTYNDHGNYCQNTRKCPNNLIGCTNLHENHDQKTYVCLNVSQVYFFLFSLSIALLL